MQHLAFFLIVVLLSACSNAEGGGDPGGTLTATPMTPVTPMTPNTPAAPACPDPTTRECGGVCAAVLTDVSNCGSCGNVCEAGVACTEGVCSNCAAGQQECGGVCTNPQADVNNCGQCGVACPGGGTCAAGVCQCPTGFISCGGTCIDPDGDGANCGGCAGAGGQDCGAAGQVCAAGMCVADGACPAGTTQCGASCADTSSDPVNCGMCGTVCAAGESCTAGACVAPTPAPAPVTTPGMPVTPGMPAPAEACPVDPGVIANFENNSLAVIEQEDRVGAFEEFNDGAGMQTTEIVAEDTDPCNQGVLRTQGSGFATFVGVGTVLKGAFDEAEQEFVPTPYDASNYTAISFRAKRGAQHANPVRFALTMAETQGDAQGDGSCSDAPGSDSPCWNHLGHFLLDDEELTTQWRTYTFCFDRDLYPMFLPSHISTERRNNVQSALLRAQFQFNQTFDPETANQVPLSGAFDFYVDDLRFTNPADCDPGGIFQSTPGTTQPFGSNLAMGTCQPVPNSATFNRAISEAYARWLRLFVRADGGVIDPDEDRVVSEAIGFGMLITAAMGDKEAFDRIYGWAKTKGVPGTLLGWLNGDQGAGSATDADTDMAFALMMAEHQWPGGTYGADGAQLASLALNQDVSNNIIDGGSAFGGVFNPSYFSPGFYRKFAGWGDVISTTYGAMTQCAASFGGTIPDWCNPGSFQAEAARSQVQAQEICGMGQACMAFEAVRVPWRIGYDLCFGDDGRNFLSGLYGTFKSGDPGIGANGERIDTIVAGWRDGMPLPVGVANTMAFLGPLAVGAMGLGDSEAVLRDRAFRATLDIMERPEFYNTYYQTTVGMLALLTMTGNFPTP